jgi:hypothetical protein
MTELPKSELAIKRDEWFESEEGIRCSEPHSLLSTSDPYIFLRNRLEAAFLAGAEANEEVKAEMVAKVLEGGVRHCHTHGGYGFHSDCLDCSAERK